MPGLSRLHPILVPQVMHSGVEADKWDQAFTRELSVADNYIVKYGQD